MALYCSSQKSTQKHACTLYLVLNHVWLSGEHCIAVYNVHFLYKKRSSVNMLCFVRWRTLKNISPTPITNLFLFAVKTAIHVTIPNLFSNF